jgi:hypothetical protein
MPRFVRNFWLEGHVDGYSKYISMGPRSKDGGFSLRIKQRDAGSISEPIRINGFAKPDGTIALAIYNEEGVLIHEHITYR